MKQSNLIGMLFRSVILLAAFLCTSSPAQANIIYKIDGEDSTYGPVSIFMAADQNDHLIDVAVHFEFSATLASVPTTPFIDSSEFSTVDYVYDQGLLYSPTAVSSMLYTNLLGFNASVDQIGFNPNDPADLTCSSECSINDPVSVPPDIGAHIQLFWPSNDPADYIVSAVPIPAGIWLFVSGLLSLIKMARRQPRV